MNREEGGHWPAARRLRSRDDAAGAGRKHLCCRWRLLLRPWWNEKGSGDRVRRNGAGGRFQRQRCATSQSPLQLFCKRRARMGAERERLLRATERPRPRAVSVSASAVGRQGMARMRIHVGGWCLVGRIFRLRFDPPVRSDRLRRRARHLQPPSPRRLPPRTRRDARKATRSIRRPGWPVSTRRGSCNRVLLYIH